MDDEELVRLLNRTAMLIRRNRHEANAEGAERPEGFPPHGPHGHHHGPHPAHSRHGQGRVLAMLSLKEGQSQKDLAYVMGIRPQSLSEIIVKLEEDGMVERRKSPDDGRVMNVYLTDKGRESATRAAENRKKNAEDSLSILNAEEKEQLGAILTKLSASLEGE